MPPKKGKGSKSNTPVAGLPSKIASLVLDGPPVKKVLDNVTCTGTLRKNIPYCDIIIDNFSVNFYGKELVKDTTLELSAGRRYGLLGANGSGKTVMLAALGQREVDIPRHFDIFHLHQEEEASDKTAIEAVCSSEETRLQLEKEAEEISRDITDDTPDEVHEYLHWIYERLEEYDSETARARAAKILHGLGFSPAMQEKKTRDFSGGWRMRISLAKGLFLRPTLMLLDEPTNHLDIEAVVWLEQYLSNWNPRGILLLISHSQRGAGLPEQCVHEHHPPAQAAPHRLRRQLRHLRRDARAARGEPEQDVQVAAGPDQAHARVHRPLRPRLAQARPPGPVQGEGPRQDGAQRPRREGDGRLDAQDVVHRPGAAFAAGARAAEHLLRVPRTAAALRGHRPRRRPRLPHRPRWAQRRRQVDADEADGGGALAHARHGPPPHQAPPRALPPALCGPNGHVTLPPAIHALLLPRGGGGEVPGLARQVRRDGGGANAADADPFRRAVQPRRLRVARLQAAPHPPPRRADEPPGHGEHRLARHRHQRLRGRRRPRLPRHAPHLRSRRGDLGLRQQEGGEIQGGSQRLQESPHQQDEEGQHVLNLALRAALEAGNVPVV